VKRAHRLLALFSLLAAFGLGGSSAVGAEPEPVVLRVAPVQDVAFPFWCRWGYDWEERCSSDDSDRLAIGGDRDKVWRAALRFSVAGIPADAAILDASLTVRHDGTCLGPQRTSRACPARGYVVDLHPILSADWFDEREVDLGPLFSRASLALASRPDWLVWDLVGLVEEWVAGTRRNDGVLLKLADEQEDFDVGGPKVPAGAFADPLARPVLEVVYLPGGGGNDDVGSRAWSRSPTSSRPGGRAGSTSTRPSS
jgi:hypothetical protein